MSHDVSRELGVGTQTMYPSESSSILLSESSRYNLVKLKRFNVFLNNYYTAVATSNSTTASGSKEDFDVNTVGLVLRQGDDASALRTLTYVIQNKAGQYVDSQINDLVCFGYGPLTSSGTTPTVVGL